MVEPFSAMQLSESMTFPSTFTFRNLSYSPFPRITTVPVVFCVQELPAPSIIRYSGEMQMVTLTVTSLQLSEVMVTGTVTLLSILAIVSADNVNFIRPVASIVRSPVRIPLTSVYVPGAQLVALGTSSAKLIVCAPVFVYSKNSVTSPTVRSAFLMVSVPASISTAMQFLPSTTDRITLQVPALVGAVSLLAQVVPLFPSQHTVTAPIPMTPFLG